MLIWTPGAQIPAAVITLASGNKGIQPIVLASQKYKTNFRNDNLCDNNDQDYYSPWVIKNIEVSLQRDWSVSMARIILSCTINNPEFALLPPLPDVSAYRGGDYPYLSEEDELRIYLGYVPSPETVLDADLLTEVPINLVSTLDKEAVDSLGIKDTFNKNACLAPVFWGFLEKVEYEGSAKGVQAILSLRDRSRVFSDTRLLRLESLAGVLNVEDNAEDGANTEESNTDRVRLLLDIANLTSGAKITTNDGKEERRLCWRPVKQGLKVIGYEGEGEDLKLIPATMNGVEIEDPSQWIRVASLIPMNKEGDPRFHVWVERPPLTKGFVKATLQVINKTPIEIINHLATTEEIPIDFYCSHVNGDFIFGPRVLDTSGFEDELRAYRTYYFLTYPKELPTPPAPNNMIISMRVLSSSLGTYNHFIITDSNVNSSNSTTLEYTQLSVQFLAQKYNNRIPSPPCKTQIVMDGSLRTYPNMETGAALIALNAARRWTRDVNGIQLELLGDPTLYPSEAIRVYNTGLHDYNTVTTWDEKRNYSSYLKSQEQLINAADAAKEIPQEEKVSQGVPAIDKIITDFSHPEANSGKYYTDIAKLKLPIYKIRQIQHKFSSQGASKGFTSLTICVADY